ncbi:uncharacterized protein LOC134829269 isoform X1 [Culicoides brevitarsis]|uniref:uncharacterized protein LOC134829269 isoform X1 n=1 Tax=Culicoides brevitarsis TaxID=469753 RepID=UPI00307C695A
MKQLWTFVTTLAAVCINSVKLQEESGRTLYSARYDNLDIDTILASNRLVTNYVDCLLNKKPCPPEGKDLKRILPEALRTKCGRCSNIQKENALKVIRNLYERYPNHYNALRDKWDKTGEYHRRFLAYLDEENFNQIGGHDSFDRDQTQINSVAVNSIQTTTTTTRRPRPPSTTRATRPPTTTQRQTRPTTTGRPTRSPSIEQAPSVSNNINNSSNSNETADETVSNDFSVTSQESPSTNAILDDDFEPQTSVTTDETRPLSTTNVVSTSNSNPVVVANRFGDTDEGTMVTNDPPRRTYPPASSPTSGRPFFIRTRPTANGQDTETTRRPLFNSNHLINNFFVPPNQQGAQGPIAGIINAIGNKVTRTTEAIVGMIHNTARIITAHHQPPNYVN